MICLAQEWFSDRLNSPRLLVNEENKYTQKKMKGSHWESARKTFFLIYSGWLAGVGVDQGIE